jgi:hypothetical protein
MNGRSVSRGENPATLTDLFGPAGDYRPLPAERRVMDIAVATGRIVGRSRGLFARPAGPSSARVARAGAEHSHDPNAIAVAIDGCTVAISAERRGHAA